MKQLSFVFIIWLTACAGGTAVSVPTPTVIPMDTAVATITAQSTPTIQTTPPLTVPTITPTITVSETAVPDHSAIAPTRDPGANLDDLIALIREKLDGRCISCLHSVMSDEFLLNFYPAGVFTGDKKYRATQKLRSQHFTREN